jgi:hypothetical protein
MLRAFVAEAGCVTQPASLVSRGSPEDQRARRRGSATR